MQVGAERAVIADPGEVCVGDKLGRRSRELTFPYQRSSSLAAFFHPVPWKGGGRKEEGETY